MRHMLCGNGARYINKWVSVFRAVIFPKRKFLPKIQKQSGDDIFIIALAEWVMFYKRDTLSEFTPNKSAHFWGII